MRDVIDDVSWVYECSHSISFSRTLVKQSELESFHYSLRDLIRHLNGLQMLDYWSDFLVPLKRYRFNIFSSLVSPSYLNNISPNIIADIRQKAEVLQRQCPCDQALVRNVLDRIGDVIKIDHNPLVREVRKASSFVSRAGLVILSERNFKESQNALERSQIKNVEIVGPNYLRRNVRYDRLILLGSTTWLKEYQYVFSAPRSKQFHILNFSWMKNEFQFDSVLAGKTFTRNTELKFNFSESGSVPKTEDHEVIPAIDLPRVKDLITDKSLEDAYEIVQAKLLILHDSNGVLVDMSQDSSVLVIDRETDSKSIIGRRKTDQLADGQFIILRTSKGGDYTAPIADHLLGAGFADLRSLQKHWKNLLRNKVNEIGLQFACAELLKFGSKIVSEGNLKNWMSPETISTKNRSDFDAIMKFISMDQESEHIWSSMKLLANAHLKAGVFVRDRIIEKMNATNFEILERTGKLSVELDDIESGALTAFKIETITDQIYDVHFRKIGVPFDLEKRFEWQE